MSDARQAPPWGPLPGETLDALQSGRISAREFALLAALYAMSKRDRTEGHVITTDAALANLLGSTPTGMRSMRRRLAAGELISSRQAGRYGIRIELKSWPSGRCGQNEDPPNHRHPYGHPRGHGDRHPREGGDTRPQRDGEWLPGIDLGSPEGGDVGADHPTIPDDHRHPEITDHRHPYGHPPTSETRASTEREREGSLAGTKDNAGPVSVSEVAEAYNRIVADGTRWATARLPLGAANAGRVRQRLKEVGHDFAEVERVLQLVRDSEFLRERKRGDTSIAWVFGRENFEAVRNSTKYRNRSESAGDGGGLQRLHDRRGGRP